MNCSWGQEIFTITNHYMYGKYFLALDKFDKSSWGCARRQPGEDLRLRGQQLAAAHPGAGRDRQTDQGVVEAVREGWEL